jgi:hypothetical protein
MIGKINCRRSSRDERNNFRLRGTSGEKMKILVVKSGKINGKTYM